MKNLTTSKVFAEFKPIAKKLDMQSVHVEFSTWGESESVTVTMYREKDTEPKVAISASMGLDRYSIKVLQLKLEADLADRLNDLEPVS